MTIRELHGRNATAATCTRDKDRGSIFARLGRIKCHVEPTKPTYSSMLLVIITIEEITVDIVKCNLLQG
jgi:hypothetical protein